jgi:hypothetical protein
MKHILTVLVLLFAFTDPAGLFAQGAPPGFPPQGRGAGPLRGPVRDVPRERPAGTAAIRGRILTADTGTPVRRAQVRAVSADSRDTRLVTTDAQGAFEFRDLAAGRWDVTASKAGFVTMRFGQRRPFEAGRPIEVADAQVMERVNFSLPRGAAITGRVLDEFGDPVAGARVQALRYQLTQGTRRLTPIGIMAQSDDTGAFRLYGLMPGDYYVSAILRALLLLDEPDEATGYAPTYYPGTGSVTEAQPVPLAVAEEANISFALMPVRTSRVSGSVLNSTGAPLANGIVMLMSPDSIGGPQAAFGAANRIRPDGTFTISNVAPGSYTLTATSGGPGRPGRGGGGADVDIEMGSLPVSVAGEDLTGITLVTSFGATMTGTVTVAQGSAAKPPATGLQITAQPVPGGGRGMGARPARVDADGTFALTNLFGPRLIRVNGLPQEWMLEAVIVAGSDVTDRPVDFGPNEEIENAQIVLTDRVTQVAGAVADRDGKPSRDFSVVVFPEDETKWASPSRYVRSARPDQQGLFKIRGLPPGDRYLAVAVDYLEEGGANDPEFLDLIKNRATRFRLGPGASTTVDLKLVER